MLAGNGKNSVSKAQAELHRQQLQQLLRHDDNRRCADCLARGPTWASVNLGVFVCLNCSGVHRSLGVDISKVRSTTLDTWLPEQVAFVQSMGNRRANLFWEGRLPGHFRRPAEGDMSALRHFISDKYRDQIYALKTWDKPPTIETYRVHPFMELADSPTPAGAELAPEAKPMPEVPARRLSQPNGESTSRRFGQISDHSKRNMQRVVKDSGSIPPAQPTASRRLSTPEPTATRRTSNQKIESTLKPPPGQTQNLHSRPPVSPELFDLLNLHEPESAPSPSVQDVLLPGTVAPVAAPAQPASLAKVRKLSQESLPDSDGGWAAFVGDASERGTAAQPDDQWDAFQLNKSNSTGGALDTASNVALEDGKAQPAANAAPFQPHISSAGSAPEIPQKPLRQHRHHKSTEEIMKIFDQRPKQDTTFSSMSGGSGSENFFAPGFMPQDAAALQGPLGGVSPNSWSAFQMPQGMPNHQDLTFPPQMFNMAQLPPFPAHPNFAQPGWSTMPGTSNPQWGSQNR